MATTTSEQKKPVIPDHVHKELADLNIRAEKVSSKGMSLMVAAFVTGWLAGGVALVGHFLGPDIHLTAMHIPDIVTNTVGSMGTVSQGSGPLDGMVTASDPLVSFITSPIVKVMAVISIVLGGLINAFGNMRSGVPGVSTLFPVILGGALMFAQFLLPSPNQGNTSDGQTLEQLASTGDYKAMSIQMTKDKVPTVLQDYVLAQAVVVYAEKSGKNISPVNRLYATKLLKVVDDAADQGAMKDSLSGDVLYALENTILGETVSKPAKEYYKSAKSSASQAEFVITSMLMGTMIMLAIGLGLFVFGRTLRSRADRIHDLMSSRVSSNPKAAPVEKESTRLGSIELNRKETKAESTPTRSAPSGNEINPASGLPMIGIMAIGGNLYGTNKAFEDTSDVSASVVNDTTSGLDDSLNRSISDDNILTDNISTDSFGSDNFSSGFDN